MELAKTVLADFFAYTARYWGFFLWLVLLYLTIVLWPFGGRRTYGAELNAGVLDYFFRGYHLEDEVFQGRLGGVRPQ